MIETYLEMLDAIEGMHGLDGMCLVLIVRAMPVLVITTVLYWTLYFIALLVRKDGGL